MSVQSETANTFGIIGILVGFAAFSAVILHFYLGPLEPPPALEEVVAETAVNIRDAAIAKIKGEAYEPPPGPASRTKDEWLKIGIAAASLAAVLLAVIGIIRKESLRVAGSAAALGILDITFQVAITLFAVLLFCVLVAAVLASLGISPG